MKRFIPRYGLVTLRLRSKVLRTSCSISAGTCKISLPMRQCLPEHPIQRISALLTVLTPAALKFMINHIKLLHESIITIRRRKITMDDPDIQNAIKNISAARRTSFPWTRNQPYPQPHFTYTVDSDGQSHAWRPFDKFPSSPSAPSAPTMKDRISVLTWNIDFMSSLAQERMSAALGHLEELLAKSMPNKLPVVILLQEMLVSDLHLIQNASWVRERFHVTDTDTSYWESGYYGTCTLIDKRLSIMGIFRVHYQDTRFERDALFVDVLLGGDGEPDTIIRVCNTHLESLVANPPLRPLQLAVAAKYMHSEAVYASILGGDLNAIQPFDRNLHTDNDLEDAYLALGNREDADNGFTWGQQAKRREREAFGCSRMDKLLFCGGLKVESLERFGIGVVVEKEKDKERLQREGLEQGWVSDHLGVRADFVLKPRLDNPGGGSNPSKM